MANRHSVSNLLVLVVLGIATTLSWSGCGSGSNHYELCDGLLSHCKD